MTVCMHVVLSGLWPLLFPASLIPQNYLSDFHLGLCNQLSRMIADARKRGIWDVSELENKDLP